MAMSNNFVRARSAYATNVKTGNSVFNDAHVTLRKQVGDVLLVCPFRWIVPRTVTGSASRFNELLWFIFGVSLPYLELFQIFGLPKVRDCN